MASRRLLFFVASAVFVITTHQQYPPSPVPPREQIDDHPPSEWAPFLPYRPLPATYLKHPLHLNMLLRPCHLHPDRHCCNASYGIVEYYPTAEQCGELCRRGKPSGNEVVGTKEDALICPLQGVRYPHDCLRSADGNLMRYEESRLADDEFYPDARCIGKRDPRHDCVDNGIARRRSKLMPKCWDVRLKPWS